MRKFKRLTMTLALLIMAVGGAWADYTVTWEGTTLQGIAVSSNSVQVPNTTQTVEGITVTASNGEFFYNTTYPKGPVVIASSSANNGLVFSAENNIKSIAITFTEMASYGSSMAFEAGAYTYQVSPAAKSFALPKNDNFIGITKVVFTLEGDAPVAAIELTPDADKKVWTLADMPANNIELQVEYEPTKVTMAANDKTMGTVEVSGESKVEWTADTWAGWTYSTKEYTVDDITMTSTNSAYIQEITEAGDYLHSLSFYVNQEDNNSTVTFSTTGDPFSRIEFTMIDDYKEDYLTNNRWNGNPVIMPKDNWTFSGKSAVWEGEATKSLTLQSCTTTVSKITFFKGAVPDGVTVNGDGTFTVAKTATVTLTATPAEGYKFLYWEDDQTNTNPVREVTIESGMDDMTYKAVFAEPTFNVTFVEGTDLNEWSATPNTGLKQGDNVTVTYTGSKKVLGMKVEKKSEAVMTTVTWNSTNVFNSAHENVELSRWYPTPLSYEGITISFSGTKASSFQAYDEDDHIGSLLCDGNDGDSFTFTAPSGKKFCKIEIINNGFIVFANYGDWTRDANNNNKIVWSGTAANEVTLGSVNTSADNLNSIVFYLSE